MNECSIEVSSFILIRRDFFIPLRVHPPVLALTDTLPCAMLYDE